MRRRITLLNSVCAALATLGLIASAAVFAAPPPSPGQASITLTNCNAGLCNANDTSWDLTKTPASQSIVDGPSTQNIGWTVTATKGDTTHNLITVNGLMTVTNTGTANATIGNVVVNLQKKGTGSCNQTWVSVAADVADATNGDAATSDKIVAAASTENTTCNASQGAHNYSVSGAAGTFTETAGSGSLSFTDANSNTIFSLVPQVSLAPGASITLLYSATFDNTVLNIPAGTQLRSEAMVSFGNAGARGGSGASATNIDINGNGVVNTDEANVRTVPCRVTMTLPALINGNSSVTLSDTSDDVTVTPTNGGVSLSNFVTDIGGGTGTAVISGSTTGSVSTDESCVAPGAATVNNTANLEGTSSSITVQGPQIGVDPVTGLPIYQQFTFACVTGVDLDASANADVACSSVLHEPVPSCSVTQGGWGGTAHGGNPASVLEANFATVYPSGVTVGGGYTMKFTSASAVEAYLPQGDTAGVLTSNLVNPTDSSSGVFGGQVLTLQITVDFEAANLIIPPGDTPIGNLYLVGTGGSLDGQTVSQILAAANIALGGGALPAGYTIGDLNTLIDLINNAFDVPTCAASVWALSHLSSTAP